MNDNCKDLNLSLPVLSSNGNLMVEEISFLSS
ncbi:unnamed protein product, partial [marine sediment metagenome]